MIDTIPALAWTCLPDGAAEFLNRRWLEYTGRTLRESLGTGWIDSIRADDLDNITNAWLKSLHAGEPREVEARLRRFDGEYRWFLFRAVPVRDEQGNVVRWFGTSTDIEDRKQAQEGFRAAASERTRLSVVREDIGMALARGGTLREILRACAEAMVQHLDATFARIWTLTNYRGDLELQASAGIYTRLDGRFSRIRPGELKIGLIAQNRKPHLTNDVQNDPRISDRDWARAEKMTSFAGYPLVVEDRIVGVMGMFSRHPLTPSTLETLAFVADGIAQGGQAQARRGKVAAE
jgi:PAS domain S-box-containing protein